MAVAVGARLRESTKNPERKKSSAVGFNPIAVLVVALVPKITGGSRRGSSNVIRSKEPPLNPAVRALIEVPTRLIVAVTKVRQTNKTKASFESSPKTNPTGIETTIIEIPEDSQ